MFTEKRNTGKLLIGLPGSSGPNNLNRMTGQIVQRGPSCRTTVTGQREKAKRERRRGWVTDERRLLEVADQRLFDEPADWLAFLPEGLQSFTANDLADAIDIRRELAQKMAYCLRQGEVIKLIGKRGRANLYRVAGL